MDTEFTIQERIELIVDLFNSYGYNAETIDEFPVAKRFINDGYAELNENNVYVKNNRGADYLHDTIEMISMDLINIMKKNGWSMPLDDMVPWFIENYCLLDKDTGELLMDYIHKNLHVYGYKVYPSRKKGKYILEKI